MLFIGSGSKTPSRFCFLFQLFLFFGALSSGSVPAHAKQLDRGEPWDFDPGPPQDSRWPELFAQTPNYRGLAKELLSPSLDKDHFRWSFGPIYYRGRLQKNQVKVFVVGHEKDREENLSNRAFSGPSGTQLQAFLNYIGITQSYLFMNTLTYPLKEDQGYPETLPLQKQTHEQSEHKLRWLSYHPRSPIVKHRHQLFDHVLLRNPQSLSLIIAVGKAGERSVATWIRSFGVRCRDLSNCETAILGKDIRVIALPHPPTLIDDNLKSHYWVRQNYKRAARQIRLWKDRDPQWLPRDKDAELPFQGPWKFHACPLPHRDFAFGSLKRIGELGKVSLSHDANRSLGTLGSIEVFSKTPLKTNPQPNYPIPTETEKQKRRAKAAIPQGDFPWEASRLRPRAFDSGPLNSDWARLLSGYLPNFEWPNFQNLGVTAPASMGNGPIYRGRLHRAKILIVADQFSHDDLFSTRALTGLGGQRLQAFLNHSQVGLEYGIIRVLPVDTLDLTEEKKQELILHPKALKLRNNIITKTIQRSGTKAILSLGEGARQALERFLQSGLTADEVPIIYMESPMAKGYSKSWREAQRQLTRIGFNTWSSQRNTYQENEAAAIPREDLPALTRWWIGSSGDRASRAYNGAWAGSSYRIHIPDWVQDWRVPELSTGEAEALKDWSRKQP